MISKADAIAIIRRSRATHQAWIEHYAVCSHCAADETLHKRIGDLAYQQGRVRDYDGVIEYLEST